MSVWNIDPVIEIFNDVISPDHLEKIIDDLIQDYIFAILSNENTEEDKPRVLSQFEELYRLRDALHQCRKISD